MTAPCDPRRWFHKDALILEGATGTYYRVTREWNGSDAVLSVAKRDGSLKPGVPSRTFDQLPAARDLMIKSAMPSIPSGVHPSHPAFSEAPKRLDLAPAMREVRNLQDAANVRVVNVEPHHRNAASPRVTTARPPLFKKVVAYGLATAAAATIAATVMSHHNEPKTVDSLGQTTTVSHSSLVAIPPVTAPEVPAGPSSAPKAAPHPPVQEAHPQQASAMPAANSPVPHPVRHDQTAHAPHASHPAADNIPVGACEIVQVPIQIAGATRTTEEHAIKQADGAYRIVPYCDPHQIVEPPLVPTSRFDTPQNRFTAPFVERLTELEREYSLGERNPGMVREAVALTKEASEDPVEMALLRRSGPVKALLGVREREERSVSHAGYER